MKDTCYLIRRPSVNVAYIYVPRDEEHKRWAYRFILSITHHRSAFPFKFTVICNGPNFDGQDVFAPVGKYDVFYHDDTGWDIGGYIAFAKSCREDILYCMGGTSYVQHSLWLERMIEAWCKHGPGFLGSLATYEVRPHLNTSGFCVDPHLLAAYPLPVTNKQQRYEFEHGYNSFWLFCARSEFPTLHVTRCGEYAWHDWRLPPNIYRRGDQSNLLTLFRHTDNYMVADPALRRGMEGLADTITDTRFQGWVGPSLPPSLR